MRTTSRASLALGAALTPFLAACSAAPPPAAPPPVVASGPATTAAPTTTTTTPAPTPAFDIVVRPVGTMDPSVLAAFEQAAQRWEGIITADVPDVEPSAGYDGCLHAGPTGTIDDLVIDVQVAPIDGPGNILGSAGPCATSRSDGLPRSGQMSFDSDDVATMQSDGTFVAVALHEMGHVLGIGTKWTPALLTGKGGSDPRFVGLGAVAAWIDMGGSGGVPVEDKGGPGTQDAHWRESTFGSELMTGWIGPGSTPLSALTISSIGDLGYHVDIGRADPYSPPAGLMAPAMRAAAGAVHGTEPLDGSEILVTPDQSF